MESPSIIIKKPARIKPTIDLQTGVKIKRKVCAYARVSTELEDQKNSYQAQLAEYSTRIKNNPDWEFVKLYSDEGITGTCLKKREGFNEMINDAMNGKIDLILVKSISRFARNTLDFLQTVRDLKEKGVEVFFDKESLSTSDPSVGIMLTILASFAQEESKSISENVKWGVRKRMEKGQRRMPTRTTLGYDEVDGKIVVNKAEAEIVIDIFDKYLAGYTIRELVKYLNDKHIKKKGSNEEWKLANISRMLSNEKYVGEFVMQKTVVLDFLTHKAYKNDGLVEQYIVPNHHEAIISKPVFEAVQALKEKNNVFKGGMLFEPVNKLTSILFCSDCLRPMKYQDIKPANGPVRKYLTCRSIDKKTAGYISCNVHETVEFEAAHKAASEVVLRFMETDERIFENIKEAYDYAINKAHDDLVVFKNEASDINSKMNLLVKLATETDDINKYKDEYEALEKKLEGINQNIEDIKSDLAKVTWDYMNTRFLSDFYKEKAITYAVVRKVIKIAFRLPDNSIRFVIGDSDLEPTRETFDAVMKLNPIYSSSVKGERKKKLKYDVVRYEGN